MTRTHSEIWRKKLEMRAEMETVKEFGDCWSAFHRVTATNYRFSVSDGLGSNGEQVMWRGHAGAPAQAIR
jgi:hypothetical protein